MPTISTCHTVALWSQTATIPSEAGRSVRSWRKRPRTASTAGGLAQEGALPMHDAEYFAAQFWAKVDKSGDCWLWMGNRNNLGYGTLTCTRTPI